MEREERQTKTNMSAVMTQYMALLDLLYATCNQQGLGKLSPSELASKLNISQAMVHKKIRNLIHFGILEMLEQKDSYRMTKINLRETPLGQTYELLELINQQPQLSYEEQAQKLGIARSELESIYGSLIYLLM